MLLFSRTTGFSGATEKNAPTWSSAYGGATRDISALHSGPCPVQFYHKDVPGALVVDAGEVDVTTIAAVEATISKTLFGRYWLAVIFESATSLQITLQSSASPNVGDYGAEGPVGGANVLRPTVTYGPLPSTYPTVTSADFATANIPRIWLRSGV
jgi:hypothetical protein